MISKIKNLNKLTLIILAMCIVFISCNSERAREEEEEKENDARKKELTENAKKLFIEKYNPLSSLNRKDLPYSYDYKKLFNDTTNSKLILIDSYIKDFDITDEGQHFIIISRGFYPITNFIIDCTKSQFEYLYKEERVVGIFVLKIKRVDTVWFDLYADGEDIIQSFTNDLIAFGDLIDFKVVE